MKTKQLAIVLGSAAIASLVLVGILNSVDSSSETTASLKPNTMVEAPASPPSLDGITSEVEVKTIDLGELPTKIPFTRKLRKPRLHPVEAVTQIDHTKPINLSMYVDERDKINHSRSRNKLAKRKDLNELTARWVGQSIKLFIVFNDISDDFTFANFGKWRNSVSCAITSELENQIIDLSPGTKIKLSGVFDGTTSNNYEVHLKDCSVK